jgi:2',3'-cyclic-nucleotide 2'-phosphodiesterase/3'-nucleotidase
MNGLSVFRLLLASALVVVVMSACSPSKDQPTVTLRILHTSDVHGKLTGYNYFSARNDGQPGFVHAAAVIAKARAEQPNNLLIDNGDLIQGDPFADWAMEVAKQANHPIIEALNSLNYDVANLGNHEFNYGLERLYEAYRTATFAVISSNVSLRNQAPQQLRELLQPWVMLPRELLDSAGNRQLLNIAVIGVVPPQIMLWDANLLVDRVDVSAMVAATEKSIAEARQAGADIIVVAAHTGLPRANESAVSDEQVVDQIAQLDHVDAIVFGHQHQVFPGANSYPHTPAADDQRGTIHGVPAVSPGYAGSHVGQIDLILQRDHQTGWQVVDFAVVALKSDVEHADQALLEQLHDAHTGTQHYVQQAVGVTQQQLSYATARLEPSSGVQFVQRAQLWYAEQRMHIPEAYQHLPILSAAAPFDAAADALEAFTEIAPGQVSLGQIADLYRYPNSLDMVKLTSQQLIDWLEASASAFVSDGDPELRWSWVNKAIPHYNFDTILGLNYRIDPQQPVGKRIQNLSFQGQSLRNDQEFLVLVNSYRASGGGNMPHLHAGHIILQSPDQLPDILRWYLTSFDASGYPHQVDLHWSLCHQSDC